MAGFNLDAKLAQDTIFLKDLELSRLLLMNDSNYPWLILVPRKEHISELFELSVEEQNTLMSEISMVSKIMKKEFVPDKINVATLGNIVKQLHVHIIVRFKHDPVWPDPVWGKRTAITYNLSQITKLKQIFY